MCQKCVLCVTNLVLVCVFTLAHFCTAIQALNFAQCTAKVGNSSIASVECSTIFVGAVNNTQSKRTQATFTFRIGDELEPFLLCRGVKMNITSVSLGEGNNCTVVGGKCACKLGQAGTQDWSFKYGQNTCECRRMFGLQLSYAWLGPVPANDKVGGARTTTLPGLAAILTQVEQFRISFTNRSVGNFLEATPFGTLETNPQCNTTTWDSSCDLKVSFNSAGVEMGSYTPTTYGWTSAVADLRLQGSVESLHLSGDHYATVQVVEVFKALDLAETTTICLSNVQIPDCSFTRINLSSLRYLNISHSKLPTNCNFMEIVADDLTSVILLNVSLTSAPRNLSRLTKLETLDLSMNDRMASNDMEEFKREIVTWKRLRNLRSLSLSQVHLGSLSVLRNLIFESDGTKCTPISNMKELRLSGCHIQDLLDENFYQCLSSLTLLDLSHNAVSTFSSRTFHPLKNMKHLSLSYNQINVLPDMEMHDETSLKLFDLSHNDISSLNNFMRSGSTTTLDISFNKIVEWDKEDMFCRRGAYLTWVKHVNISYNSLKTVSRTMGDSLSVLGSVDLRGNKFDCSDCNTTEFQKWLAKSLYKFERLSVVGANSKGMVCTAPKSLAGQEILKVQVDPSHCAYTDTQNYYVLVLIPLIAFVFAMAVIGSAMAYKFRFELAYIRYYWSIKKRRQATGGTENGEYDFDAFVSYSRHDRAWVLDELMVNLETRPESYKLCLHERDFRLGSLILENIETSMRKSRYTLVVLSRGFVDSQVTHQWCRWELEMANYKLFDDRREFLILVQLEFLERREMPRHLKYLIETRTYLEWPGPGRPNQQATFWRRLKKALGESLHQRQQRLSASPPLAPDDQTTETTVTAATTTTIDNTTAVITSAANSNDKHYQATMLNNSNNHYVEKNNKINRMMALQYISVKHVVDNNAIVALPHAKFIDQSEV